MSQIHFIGGEKGGVGKSVFARLLAQWCVDRGLPFAAVDCDPFQGSLQRSYGEYTQGADLTSPESADQIVDRALAAERRVLVDLPAQSARSLEAWLDGAKILEFARDMGVPVTFFHVTDGGAASVKQIERALNHLGDRVKHVVVQNLGRSKDFGQFEESPAKQRLFELAGKQLSLPELDPPTMYKVDRLALSFWAAAHSTDGQAVLKPLERRRVEYWLERCYRELATLDGAL